MIKTIIGAVLGLAIAFPAFGDEFILDESRQSEFVGDFSVSNCNFKPTEAFQVAPDAISISAGDLWKHFKDNGIASTNHIVICMDLEPGELSNLNNDVGVEQVELTIKDPYGDVVLTSFSLDRNGDHSLIVPGYETSSRQAEALMEIDLGFDFMERFSESSDEKVFLNVKLDGRESSTPNLFISSKRSLFSMPNFFLLGGFAAFWLILFYVLFKFTSPVAKPKTISTKQAVSV